MPTMTTQKSLLIAGSLVFAAVMVSTGYRENAGFEKQTAGTATYLPTLPLCTAAHRVETRTPIYKRYLHRTSVTHFTPRPRG